ncbi:MAG: alpha/beta fold hydrolase [Myxococcales bacterium]|nr:alpha/beta fold hydrolase [Myxococcales bacterium]
MTPASPSETIATAIKRNRAGAPALPDLDLDVGVTPRDLIHTNGTARLFRYRPVVDEVYRTPVLLVPSLVSRPYILDLAEGQSLVGFLLQRGFDVYLVDWGTPRAEHSGMALEDYVLRLLPESVEIVVRESDVEDVSLIGYCLGGQLACMYAATHCDGPLRNLACFTTPINSDGMRLYQTWTDSSHFDLDDIVKELGNIPPELISAPLQALRPFQQTAGQLRLLQRVGDDEFVKASLRLDRWAADQVPVAGEAARQLVTEFLRENKLVRNQMRLASQRVDFGSIRTPFLHVAAQHDHVVPRESSKDLLGLIGSDDKAEIVIKGGHVSLVAGGNAVYRLWPQVDRWLSVRSI